MKVFRLHGNTANWSALKLEALNTATEEKVSATPIPHDMKIRVHVVNNFYRVYDKEVRQILHGEISTEDNAELLARLTRAKRPAFILFHNGVVVGYATLHHRHRLKNYHGIVRFTIEMPQNVVARTEAEAIEKLSEYARNAADLLTAENSDATATFEGAEIAGVERL